MSERSPSKLRIYADFNSGGDGWCWCLRYQEALFDDVAASLGAYDGMPVTLFYEDPAEEFEVDAILGHSPEPGWNATWMALPDWSTMRYLRG